MFNFTFEISGRSTGFNCWVSVFAENEIKAVGKLPSILVGKFDARLLSIDELHTPEQTLEFAEVLDRKDTETEKLREDLRKSYTNLSQTMDTAFLYREPVRVHLEIDFKNFPKRRK